MDAGRFDQRVTFQRRVTLDDGYGNSRGDWKRLATVWGFWAPQFGREAVQADRLESSTRGVLTVRYSKDLDIAASDQVLIEDEAFQIRSIVPRRSQGLVEMVLEGGVAS